MPAPRARTSLLCLSFLAVLGAIVLGAGMLDGAPRVSQVGHLYTVRDGRLVYQFDAAWRVEKLYESEGGDPDWRHNVAPARPEAVTRLRGVLLDFLGMHSLDQVPQEGEKEKRALKGLGYL